LGPRLHAAIQGHPCYLVCSPNKTYGLVRHFRDTDEGRPRYLVSACRSKTYGLVGHFRDTSLPLPSVLRRAGRLGRFFRFFSGPTALLLRFSK
jgi:hypothetical protein